MKKRIAFSIFSWDQYFSTSIESSSKKITTTHNKIITESTHLIIYTNENNIVDKIKILTIIMFNISSQISIIIDKKQAYFESLTKYTIYSEKLININFAINIIHSYSSNIRLVAIFINNQIVIQTVQIFKRQSKQSLLIIFSRKFKNCEKTIELQWISTHIKVSNNKTTNITIKKIINWKQKNKNKTTLTSINFLYLFQQLKSKSKSKSTSNKWKTELKNQRKKLLKNWQKFQSKIF